MLNAGSVGGQAAGDIEELTGDDVSDSADEDKDDDAGEGNGNDARDAAGFEAADGGGQQKGQGEGEGEGDEELAGQEEDEDRDGEHEKGDYPGKLGASSTGHRTSRSHHRWSGLSGKHTSRRLIGVVEWQRMGCCEFSGRRRKLRRRLKFSCGA